MRPMISIITPTYNHERYIHECIESVLNQTYPNWEMIIMDDGSTDATPAIISRYSDTRITYFRKDHQGIDKLGESYNEALQRSKGELILILEGDDYIPTDRLEKQWSTFQEEQVVLSHGKYGYVLGDKLIVYPSLFRLDDLRNRPIGSALKIFLQGFNPIGTQSVMIRKSSLLKIGGFVQPTYLPLVDYPTWMRLALIGTFEYIPELLGYWRRHPFSITINHNEQILNGFIKYCDEFVLSYGASFKNLHLTRAAENRGTLAYLALAWSHLSQRNWEKALRLAQESWGRRTTVSWSFQAKMILTLLSSYLHLDLPSFFKKARQSLHEHGTTRH
jgi:glycosyltransferase involved in cell wall biosynthesis